jgi:branched-chain amino acid transport system permease protein
MSRLRAAWQWVRAHPLLWRTVAIVAALTYTWWYDVPPMSYITVDLLGVEPDVAVFIGVYVLLALGLNIVVGYAGLLDLGYVAFFALGAYTVGWLSSGFFNGVTFHVGSSAPEGLAGVHLSFWLVVLAAGVIAATAGVLIGWPTLRLRGDYLAIVTLGFGEIIPDVFRNGDSMPVPCGLQVPPPFIDFCKENVTNGVRGIRPLDAAGFPGLSSINDDLFPERFSRIQVTWFYIVIVVLVLIVIFVISRLQDSKMGRAWIAVREDEIAASAMGVPLMRTKLWAYGIGAVFGGIGGAYYGSFIGSTDPTSFFFNISVIVLCMVIVGGMGNIPGVVLGAIVLQYLNFTGLDKIGDRINDFLDAVGSDQSIDVPKYKFLFFGILLVVMMLVRPEGILPSARRAAELHETEEGPEADIYDDLYDVRREGD